MTSHKTRTREKWRTARLELLEAEKELTGGATTYPGGRTRLVCK